MQKSAPCIFNRARCSHLVFMLQHRTFNLPEDFFKEDDSGQMLEHGQTKEGEADHMDKLFDSHFE